MEQAIYLNYIRIRRKSSEKRQLAEAVKLCKEAGFTRFDYFSDSLDDAKRERELFDSQAVKVIQSHCPFFRYQDNGLEKFRRTAGEAVKIAAALGAEFLVIHADEYRMNDEISRKEMLKITREYLAPVVDLCGQYGLKTAIENLFEEKGPGHRTRFCSEAEEVIDVIESFPGTGIGCCWDSGHHHVSFGDEKFFEKLEMLAPYIICTHIHDNRYGVDMHKPAFFGTIDWEKVMEVLKKYHYQGDFSWEFVHDRVPDAVYGEYLRFIHASGNYLLNL